MAWPIGRARTAADRRIIYVTPGYRMKALDATTGAPIPAFGRNGVVDLKLEDDQEVDLDTSELGLNATPLVVGDVIVVGHGASARIGAAHDAQRQGLGARLRRAHGQAAVDLPHHPAARRVRLRHLARRVRGVQRQHRRVGADERRPGARPASTCRSRCRPATTTEGNRPGDSLFADSLLALDVKTGRRKWHYQTVHHDVWDWDLPCAPILFDMRVDGRAVKAIAQPTKQAMLFVFNRETGEPIWPIEERPVPRPTCRRSARARRSRFQPGRRRSIARALPRTTCST